MGRVGELTCHTGGTDSGEDSREVEEMLRSLSIEIPEMRLHKQLTVTIACFVSTILGISKNVIGYIFTSDLDILQRASDVIVIFSFLHLADAIGAVAGGVLRGVGKQLVGALCNLVGYYFIGLPTGASLMFAAKMGIVGFWTGLTVCVLVQSIFFITFLCRLDWKKVAEEAKVRAGVRVKEEKDTIKMENRDSNHIQTPISTIASSGESAGVDHVYMEVQIPEESKTTNTTTVGDVLSVSQLLLRRGLTILIMILILAAGIITSTVLTLLLK